MRQAVHGHKQLMPVWLKPDRAQLATRLKPPLKCAPYQVPTDRFAQIMLSS